ncbi:MAG: ParB/RepB/Spo0J family partition protein [Clostridia bacterium]|nr:ParB/RepB/Spo0J family partition protein [Clostridia bacterium]
MATPKRGLGKGLGALLMENEIGENTPVSLKITDIVPNAQQPRHQFDEDALRELSDSIAQHGVLQPLLVRPMTDGTYQLVAGERRWRAARMAGLAEVPVVIREMTDQESATLALIENLQREDLNPREEATGYRSLMDAYGLTQEEAARVVGKSRPAVTNALRLLQLPEPVTDMVADGRLSAGHARALLAFDSEQAQRDVAAQIVDKQLSVRAVEKLAQQAKKPAAKPAAPRSRHAFYDEVELALTEHLGRKVKVAAGKQGGTLTLEFYDRDDLRKLANTLAPDV